MIHKHISLGYNTSSGDNGTLHMLPDIPSVSFVLQPYCPDGMIGMVHQVLLLKSFLTHEFSSGSSMTGTFHCASYAQQSV